MLVKQKVRRTVMFPQTKVGRYYLALFRRFKTKKSHASEEANR